MKMFAIGLVAAVLFLKGASSLAAEPAFSTAAVVCHSGETLLPAPSQGANGVFTFVTCEGVALAAQTLNAELLGSACVQVILSNGARTWVTMGAVRA